MVNNGNEMWQSNELDSFSKQDRLSGLVLLSYYREISLASEEILDEMSKKPRKIDNN